MNNMLSAKITAIIGAIIATASLPAIAQANDTVSMPWPVNVSALGILGGLLWHQLVKGQPAESKRRGEEQAAESKRRGEELDRVLTVHKEGLDDVSSEMKGLRGDMQRNQESQLELLRQVVQKQ